jgi:hypothetical protein
MDKTKFTEHFMAEQRVLAEKATERPYYTGVAHVGGDGKAYRDVLASNWRFVSHGCTAEDAEFLVSSGNNFIPALDELERLRAANEALTAKLQEAESLYRNDHDERVRLEERLKMAEAVITTYADSSNWSDTALYEAEDWKSVNSNGCPDTYEVEVCIGDTVVWVSNEKGPKLADEYFEKYDEQEPAQP